MEPETLDNLLNMVRSHIGDANYHNPVRTVQVQPPSSARIATEVVDWWPIEEIESRQAALNRYGPGAVNWYTSKGALRMAAAMSEVTDNRSRLAGWLAGFAHEAKRSRVRGIALDHVCHTACEAFYGGAPWHHLCVDVAPTCPDLPRSIDTHDELARYAALYMLQNLAAYQIVRVVSCNQPSDSPVDAAV